MSRPNPPPPPQLPPPPKPQEILDTIDEITGTQTITVTGADGKKRRVTSKLPRTPQEQQRFEQGERLIASAIGNLNILYQEQPERLNSFQPLLDMFSNINDERLQDLEQIANIGNIQESVNRFREINRNLMYENFRRQNNATEEGLAHRGMANSTAGNDLRAQLAREQSLASQQAELQAEAFGEGLANQRLQRNAQAYGLREQGRQGRMDAAQRTFDLQERQRDILDAQRQDAINRNLQQLNVGSGLTGQDLSKSLAGNTSQNSLMQFQAANNNQLNYHNANINRLNADYQNRLAHFQATPPSFGQSLGAAGLQLGMTGLGAMAGGAGTAFGNMAGQRLGNAFGWRNNNENR